MTAPEDPTKKKYTPNEFNLALYEVMETAVILPPGYLPFIKTIFCTPGNLKVQMWEPSHEECSYAGDFLMVQIACDAYKTRSILQALNAEVGINLRPVQNAEELTLDDLVKQGLDALKAQGRLLPEVVEQPKSAASAVLEKPPLKPGENRSPDGTNGPQVH